MQVGDLVRVRSRVGSSSKRPAAPEFALVTEVEVAYPADPREHDLLVSVLFSDGQGETWYDWQLELVS